MRSSRLTKRESVVNIRNGLKSGPTQKSFQEIPRKNLGGKTIREMSWPQDGIMRTSMNGGHAVYRCKKCHFVTSSEMNALCHVRVCHAPSGTNYRCDKCGFRTHNEDNFRMHSVVQHSLSLNMTYQCSECSFCSVDKMALMHHVHSVHYIASNSSHDYGALHRKLLEKHVRC